MSPTSREDNELPSYLYPFFEKERFNESKRHLSVFLACKHVTRQSYWTTKVRCEENYISLSRNFGPIIKETFRYREKFSRKSGLPLSGLTETCNC